MKKLLPLLLLLCFPQITVAEDPSKIAAIVGNEAISILDVQNRALMMVNSSSPNPGSPAAIKAAMPDALQTLIDEKLYTQEAARLKITVSKDELNNAVANIEGKNKVQPGEFEHFLKQRGIPFETVKDQIRAQIMLAKIVNSRIRPKVTVSEREIETAINQSGGDNRELSLKQLFLPISVESTTKEQTKSKSELEKFRKKVKGCDDFDAAAQSFTPPLSPNNLTVNASSLNPAIRDMVMRLQLGEASEIIQAADNFQLLMVCEKSEPTISAADRTRISGILQQRKMEPQVKQYIRDLRVQTYIEIMP